MNCTCVMGWVEEMGSHSARCPLAVPPSDSGAPKKFRDLVAETMTPEAIERAAKRTEDLRAETPPAPTAGMISDEETADVLVSQSNDADLRWRYIKALRAEVASLRESLDQAEAWLVHYGLPWEGSPPKTGAG